MRKTVNMKKWIIGVVLMLTTFVGVGQDDVYRVHRKVGTLEVTTIVYKSYFESSFMNDLFFYRLHIFCDSINENKKVYTISAYIPEGMGYPSLHLLLTSGDTLHLSPTSDYLPSEKTTGIEAVLTEEALQAIKKNKLAGVYLFHWDSPGPEKPRILKCGDFLRYFITKY